MQWRRQDFEWGGGGGGGEISGGKANLGANVEGGKKKIKPSSPHFLAERPGYTK